MGESGERQGNHRCKRPAEIKVGDPTGGEVADRMWKLFITSSLRKWDGFHDSLDQEQREQVSCWRWDRGVRAQRDSERGQTSLLELAEITDKGLNQSDWKYRKTSAYLSKIRSPFRFLNTSKHFGRWFWKSALKAELSKEAGGWQPCQQSWVWVL